MKPKKTPIFVITLMVKQDSSEVPANTRCIGWFHSLHQAKYAFEVDRGHMSSCLYTHGVIERTVPGIYPGLMLGRSETWYRFAIVKNRAIPLGVKESWEEIEKPNWSNNINGWGIG